MITKEKIHFLVEEVLAVDQFIVDITVGSGNAIHVSLDSDTGISIGECAQISRHIENSLDREIEDFSLEVSSPGLTSSFKVLRQYLKNIGREVDAVANSGDKQKGILKAADSEGFELEVVAKEKIEGKLVLVTKSLKYNFDQIKTVKLLITFK